MQTLTSHPKKKTSAGSATVILSLLLGVLFAVSGFFGANYIINGKDTIEQLPTEEFIDDNTIPTDENGNNLTGNYIVNLQNGGLLASQADSIFFTNFSDGGSLYCQTDNGKVTKLTDFPVANLNICGDTLIFTDISASSITGTDETQIIINAKTHEELWKAAGESQNIVFGGNLYIMKGIDEFAKGERSVSEIEFITLDNPNTAYLSPILSDGYLVSIKQTENPDGSNREVAALKKPVFIAMSLNVKGSGTAASSYAYDPFTDPPPATSAVEVTGPDGESKTINCAKKPGDTVEKVVTSGGHTFVQMFPANGRYGDSYIVHIDNSRGIIAGRMDGAHGMIGNNNGAIYFRNYKDELAYEMFPPSSRDDGYHYNPQPMSPLMTKSDLMLNPGGEVSFLVGDPSDSRITLTVTSSRESKKIVNGKVVFGQAPVGERYTYINLPNVSSGKYRWVKDIKGYTYTFDPKTGKWKRVVEKNGEITETDLGGWNKPLQDWKREEMPQLRFVKSEEFIEALAKERLDKLSKPNKTTANDMSRALAAITNMLQGYSYYEQKIDMAYNQDQYQRVIDYFGQELKPDDYIDEIVETLISSFGFDNSYRETLKDTVKYWMKLFESAVGECVIDNSDVGGGKEGIAMLVPLKRVHLTTENFSKAISASIENYPGGRSAIAADTDAFKKWAMQELVSLFNNPAKSGFLEEPDETPAIVMVYDENVGWVPDSLNSIRRHFIVIDPDIELDTSYLPKGDGSGSSGEVTSVEGVWQRTTIPGEQIEFRGNRIKWTFGGKVITQGTFEITEDGLLINAGAQGSTTFAFSQDGDVIMVADLPWVYERKSR